MHVVVQRVLDHRLDRCKARAAGDENDRLVGVLAQIERPQRPFETQDLAALELVEERLAEVTAWHVADMQLEQHVVLGRGGDREAAPPAVFEEQVDVLPGEVLQPLAGGELQRHDRDVGRGLVDLLDPARELPDLDVTGAADFAHFDRERRLRLRDAEEREPLRLLGFGQRARLVHAVVHHAVEKLPLARTAGTIAATVWNHQVGAHRGGQHGFAIVAGEAVLARFYGNLEWHRCAQVRE